MDANGARYFEENFASRGVDVTWGKKTKSAPANITNGDAVVMALAKQYVPINKSGLYEAGKNVDGTINFGGWFSAYLKARKMSKDCGVPFIDAVSKEGMVLAGEAVVNDKGISQHVTDLIVSPGLVKGLSVDISSMVVTFEISWHDLPVVDSESKCPSGLGKYHINMTRVCLRRSPEESTIDIATKFLKFALSVSNFTFANIYDVVISGLDPADAKTIYETVLDEVISSKPIYANPLIMLVWGEKHNKTMRYVRDVSDEFLSDCQKYVAYVDAQREQGVSANDVIYPAQIGCGRFGSDFLGDYLTGSQITLPGGNASYGATFEETVLNCMNNLSSVATKVENMSAEEKKKVLFGDGEEEEKNVATDATSSNDGASEDVAGGEELSDEPLEDDIEEGDNASLEYGLRVKEILDMYSILYKEDAGPVKYIGVGLIPQNYEKDPFVLYERRYPTKSEPTWDESAPFKVLRYPSKLLVEETDYNYFRKAMGNLWRGLYAQGKLAPIEAFSPKRALPKSMDDLTWLNDSMKNNRPSVGWFPFIHAAMMHHYAPWDFCKKNPKHYSWEELRGRLEKWLMAIFKRLGEITDDDMKALDDLKEALMRHFVVSESPRSFSFSIYWSVNTEITSESLTTYLENTLPTLANTLISCDPDPKTRGRYMCSFVPNLNGFLGETLLGFEVLKKFLDEHDGKLRPEAIPIGMGLNGRVRTLDVKGAGNVFPATIRAGARSGKGVLTQLLMIALLGCGRPFIYLDSKPDMAKTWADYGRRFNVRTLGADPMAEASQFILAGGGAAPIDACASAVLGTSDYAPLLNGIYFSKLVALMYGLSESRLSPNNKFSADIFDTFIIADEVNVMGKSLLTLKNLIPDSPSIGSRYATARKEAEKAYKSANKGGLLPKDFDITVDEFTFKVCEWDKVLGANGKGEPLNDKIHSLITGVGTFFGTLTTSAPKAHIYPIYIGQTDKIDLSLVEKNFATSASLALRAPQRMALIGKGWSSPAIEKEQGWEDTRKALMESTNSELTEGDPVGVFLYKASRGDKNYQIIRTGVVLAENDAEQVEFVDGAWTRQEYDMAGSMLKNIQKAAGDRGEKFSKAFRENKLLVTESTARDLAAVGMSGEIGRANPLVTFDGLLEYVAKNTNSDPAQPVERLYLSLSNLLEEAGSGFTDVYTYLLDPSAMYTGLELSVAVKSGKPLIRVGSDDATGSDMFDNLSFDDEGSGGEPTVVSGTTPTAFTAPNTPMPTNPARATAPVAPATSGSADSSFGRGAMPTFESAMAKQAELERAEAERRAEAEGYACGDGFEDADNFGGFESAGGEYTDGAPDIDYYAGSAEDGGSVVSADEYESGETPVTRPMERRTPAPSVCGTSGASSRYAGGSSPYAENPDGTITLEVPGGKVTSYYTAAETVQTLSRLYDDDKARKLAQTPKGRAIMALESMRTLVKMLEDKTGLNRAMIKSVTFADNCLFVRDACVIGGKPDSYDLYDYVDIKNFLKAMSGLTVLRMDRNAYFNLIVRPGCSAQDAFLYSQTLQTFQFDNCQMLRDGRIVGETPDAAKDSFIADFDKVATENSIPTSKSKLFSGAFRERAERESKILHTPEYQEKSARLTKLRRDLYGKKAEQYIEEDRPISGFFSALRFWLLDKRLARVQSQL